MSSFDTDRSPTLRELYTLFIPLAFSGAFFPVARPVTNAALARRFKASADPPACVLKAISCYRLFVLRKRSPTPSAPDTSG